MSKVDKIYIVIFFMLMSVGIGLNIRRDIDEDKIINITSEKDKKIDSLNIEIYKRDSLINDYAHKIIEETTAAKNESYNDAVDRFNKLTDRKSQ